MKKNKELVNYLVIGFCALAVSYAAIAAQARLFSSLNDLPLRYIHFSKDLRKSFKKGFQPVKIVAAAIDINTIENMPGRFPFSRSVYAELVRKLDREKVNTIGFDLVFTASSEAKDDSAFSEALKNISHSKVVLAFMLGSGINGQPYILPQPEFLQKRVSLGLLDNPEDNDRRVRRLSFMVSTETDEKLRYSLAVQLAAAFLNKPAAQLMPAIPAFRKDILSSGLLNIGIESALMNYVEIPGENKLVTRVSFFDLYNDLEKLKKKFGEDFLENSLVLVYPEAEILHDTGATPVGKMPGGFLHLNGFLQIISSRFLVDSGILTFVLLAAGLALIFFSLKYFGFFSGLVFIFVFLLVCFWAAVALWLKGIVLNLGQIIMFSGLFFAVGSSYKYILAILQLESIKNKVVLDPLRNFFTLRYFYYHFDLSARKIYLGKELYLYFVSLVPLKAEIQNMSLNSIRSVWQKIQPAIKSAGGFWATYSSEEIAGGVFCRPKNAGILAQALKNTLQAMFNEIDLKVNVKIGYLKVKKEYSSRELLYVLSGELKKSDKDVVLFDSPDFYSSLRSLAALKQEENEFLESIDADIEEKNRELMEVIENLNKEQMKSREMFFQVILSLVNALDARDPYTEGHSQRVTGYALKLAEKIGWNKEEIEKLRKASLMHDLGKIGIPDSILHKKDRLSEDEFDFIKKHEIIAVNILAPIKEMAEVLPWILYHHERWDGKGYPHGLGGSAIPLASQIIALADVYDALTTGRDYKKAMTVEDSLIEIEKNKGTQFKGELVEAFTAMIRQEMLQK